nr:hypothetical protein B0A51_13622 [Rachicladosporium sp. CCFEE 5018]
MSIGTLLSRPTDVDHTNTFLFSRLKVPRRHVYNNGYAQDRHAISLLYQRLPRQIGQHLPQEESYDTPNIRVEAMYNLIVARISKKNFEAVNNKDYDAILEQCDARIHHRFGGSHALQ